MANLNSIVLIDDNKVESVLAKEALKKVEGTYNLQLFDDPISAFNFIEEHAKEIQMIICDINMPKMTGIELLKQIDENEELRLACVPFIFLSNSADDEEVKQAYKLTAQGYFQKPFDLSELTRTLKTIIEYWQLAKLPKGV